MKIEIIDYEGGRLALFYCPGCTTYHGFKLDRPQKNGSIWIFDNNINYPTFSPSLLINAGDINHQCHLFVKKGKIHYCADCFHILAGNIIDLPEFDGI